MDFPYKQSLHLVIHLMKVMYACGDMFFSSRLHAHYARLIIYVQSFNELHIKFYVYILMPNAYMYGSGNINMNCSM